MNQPEAKRARAAFDDVRAILHGEWDPIGCGVPRGTRTSAATKIPPPPTDRSCARQIAASAPL